VSVSFMTVLPIFHNSRHPACSFVKYNVADSKHLIPLLHSSTMPLVYGNHGPDRPFYWTKKALFHCSRFIAGLRLLLASNLLDTRGRYAKQRSTDQRRLNGHATGETDTRWFPTDHMDVKLHEARSGSRLITDLSRLA
jgi:hypothetical protein